MKKFLVLLLSMVLAASCAMLFVGCGDKTGGGGTNNGSGTPTTEPTVEPTDRELAMTAIVGAGMQILGSGAVADVSMDAYTGEGDAKASQLVYGGKLQLSKIDLNAPKALSAELAGDVRKDESVSDTDAKKVALTYLNDTLYLAVGDSQVKLAVSGIESVVGAVEALAPQPVAAGVKMMSAAFRAAAGFDEIGQIMDDLFADATYNENGGTVSGTVQLALSAVEPSLPNVALDYEIANGAFVRLAIVGAEISGVKLDVAVDFTSATANVTAPEGEFGDVTPVFTALSNTMAKKYFEIEGVLDFYLNLSDDSEANASHDYDKLNAKIEVREDGSTYLRIDAKSQDKNADGTTNGQSVSYFDGEYFYYDYSGETSDKGKVLANDVMSAPATVLFNKIVPSPSITSIITLASYFTGQISMGSTGSALAVTLGEMDMSQLVKSIQSETIIGGTKLMLTLDLSKVLDIQIPFLGQMNGDTVSVVLTTIKGQDGKEYVKTCDLKVNITKPDDPNPSDAFRINISLDINVDASLDTGSSVLDGLDKSLYTKDLSVKAAEAAKALNEQIAALPEVDALTINDFDAVKTVVSAYTRVTDELTKAYIDSQKLVDSIAKLKQLWAADVQTNLAAKIAALFPGYDGTDATLPTDEEFAACAAAVEELIAYYTNTIPTAYVSGTKVDTEVIPQELADSYQKLKAAYEDYKNAAQQAA